MYGKTHELKDRRVTGEYHENGVSGQLDSYHVVDMQFEIKHIVTD